MVVQYLIDWESLFPANTAIDIRLCEQLLRLSAMIRRNGCLIRSRYSSLAIVRLSLNTNELFCGVLSEFGSLYEDFGIRVDHDVPQCADNLHATQEAWKRYLQSTGLSYERNDSRFVLISREPGRGVFFCQRTLDQVLSDRGGLAVLWTRVQHFGSGLYSDFKKYFEAFVAATDKSIRIYDPYGGEIFAPVKNAANIKAWRNSFAYILGVLLHNQNIEKIDIITSMDVKPLQDRLKRSQKLLFAEVIQDLIQGYSTLPNNGVTVSFHFLSGGRSFHDRFIANNRFCFAVGHGCDVCEAGNAYFELIRRQNRGEEILNMQWRSMPPNRAWEFSDFNVFYGCSRFEAPSEICVFENGGVNTNGSSRMYPSGCRARNFGAISDCFEWGDYRCAGNGLGQVVVNNVTININPQEGDF